MGYRHPDPDVWLQWLGTIGKWPWPVRDLGEEYAGVTCYRLKKAHVWIQQYDFGGTAGAPELFVDLIQGRDSIFPGVIIKHVPVQQLTHCDCGHFMPPTKEQGEKAEAKYKAALMNAKRVLN